MKTIIDKTTGKVSFATDWIEFDLLDSEIAVDEILIDNFENPHYNFDTKTFYDKLNEQTL